MSNPNLFDEIKTIFEQLGAPKAVFFGSSVMAPEGVALKVEQDGADYMVAHPMFWRQLDTRQAGLLIHKSDPSKSGAFETLFGIPIWDLAKSPVMMRKFLEAFSGSFEVRQ